MQTIRWEVSRTCRTRPPSALHSCCASCLTSLQIYLICLSCSHVSGDNFIVDFTCLVKRNLNNDKRRSPKSKMRTDQKQFPGPNSLLLPCKKRTAAKIKNCGCLYLGPSFRLLKILMLSHLHLSMCVCVCERSRSTRQIALGLVRCSAEATRIYIFCCPLVFSILLRFSFILSYAL